MTSLLEHFVASLFPLASHSASGVRDRSMLRVYQRFMADKIRDMEAVLLAVPMGMGKTAATLTGVTDLLERHPDWRVLIVAPLEVAKNTWPDEIALWAHLRHLTYAVACGTPEQRQAALAKRAQITMINRENLQWLWETIGGDNGWEWKILIYDESSRLKSFVRRTPPFKYKDGKKIKVKPNLTEFGVLAQARKHVERVVELTGTPSPNGLIDLGGQVFILDMGERLGANKNIFEQRYFTKNQYSYEVKPLPHAEKQIMGAISDIMIGLRAEDYEDIKMPPLVISPRHVRLPPSVMQKYRQFERDSVSEAYDVEAVTRAVLTNKLLQFCNGGLYKHDPDDPQAPRETIPIHDLKLKALESIIEEAAGENVLVAYSFKFDKERIKKKFPKAVFFDEEPNFVKKWNAGKIRIGVAHPASIGHGLNLQHGGHIQVWYGLNWSLELWDQFNRRLARPGQKAATVYIYPIVAEGTVDEDVLAALETKGATQDRITEAVRVRLKIR